MRTTLFILAWAALLADALVGVTYLDKHESRAEDCNNQVQKEH
jgi:hypothetical protein